MLDIQNSIRNKDYESLITLVLPMINKIAQKFAAVKTPTRILEKDDYIQTGYECVIECVNNFDLNQVKDAESCKAKFLSLCYIKITSRCIEMQKSFYLPIRTSHRTSTIHCKINQMPEEDITVEGISQKFNASKKLATEAISLKRLKFQKILTDNGNLDIVINDKTINQIYAKEVLSCLTNDEYKILYSVLIDKICRNSLAEKYNMSLPQFYSYFNKIIKKVKKYAHATK